MQNPGTTYIEKGLENYFAARPEVIAVYLFGSFARGRDRSDSDVDVGILLKQTAVGEEEDLVREYLVGLSKMLKKDVHPVIMNFAGEGIMEQIFAYGRCILNRDPQILSAFKMTRLSMIADFSFYRDMMKKGFVRRIMRESR